MFTLEKTNDDGDRFYWVCARSYKMITNPVTGKKEKKRICRSRGICTIVNGIHEPRVKPNNASHCEPDASALPLATFKAIIKGKALSPGAKPSKVIQQASAMMSVEVLSLAPTKNALRCMIKRIERRNTQHQLLH